MIDLIKIEQRRLSSYLGVYNFSSLCLIHLAFRWWPVCLHFCRHYLPILVMPGKLPVLCSRCWTSQIPRHHCQCCSSSSYPSTLREETFFSHDFSKWIEKIILSHITTSSARFLSWIWPSYANLFSPSPAGTYKRIKCWKTIELVLAWLILSWPYFDNNNNSK